MNGLSIRAKAETTINSKNARISKLSDEQLFEEYHTAYKKQLDEKVHLDNVVRTLNENQYIEVAMARLTYEFAKENYRILQGEVQERGLIT